MSNLRDERVSTRQQERGGGPHATRFFAAPLLMASLCLGVILPAAGAEPAEVVVEKMQFVPQVLRIKPGMTVTWVNREKRSNHSILFEQENLESDRFFPGETYQRAFDKPGIYPYRCGPHPEMLGVIEVAE
ncbi:MAG: plastocyanin/azurin family copper-binding protein [Thiobacillus sp.]|nr:plastocyanin/azurin family copper-binding protein [Thiobacillus sp.]MDP2979009.1 plastocyanin/azurin family copper-binding protein [Thiobacillus sp.]